MENKRPHPALTFAKARLRNVSVCGTFVPVWMAPSIDDLLEDFIEQNHTVGDELGQQRCPFGAVLWPSARALWEWLLESDDQWNLVAPDKDDAHVRVIELGTGVGFLSALMAAHTRWSITASDYEPAYQDYLAANCKVQKARDVPFVTLDWCEKIPDPLQEKHDLVVACDVLYDDTHLQNIPRVAAELLKPDGALVLADPERFRFDAALDELKKSFSHVRVFTTSVEHQPEDALKSGTVNATARSTQVKIVHCQNPLRVKPRL